MFFLYTSLLAADEFFIVGLIDSGSDSLLNSLSFLKVRADFLDGLIVS